MATRYLLIFLNLFEIAIHTPSMDQNPMSITLVSKEMDQIKVVPNPYCRAPV